MLRGAAPGTARRGQGQDLLGSNALFISKLGHFLRCPLGVASLRRCPGCGGGGGSEPAQHASMEPLGLACAWKQGIPCHADVENSVNHHFQIINSSPGRMPGASGPFSMALVRIPSPRWGALLFAEEALVGTRLLRHPVPAPWAGAGRELRAAIHRVRGDPRFHHWRKTQQTN